MTTLGSARATVTEYAPELSSNIGSLAAASGRDRSELIVLLAGCSARLQADLALPDPPIQLIGDSIHVSGVAGLVEVAPRLELEVSPKFLGTDEPDWREDFFVFATLSRYGRILDRDVVGGGFGGRRDLGTLIGRTALRLHERNQRYPLRLYRTVRWRAFEAEGELDEEEVLSPDTDGFLQSAVSLKRDNIFTGVIGSAFRILASEVTEPSTRKRVERVAQSYPNSGRSQRRLPARVPTRHARWQPTYELSKTVIRGSRIDYSGQSLGAIGYAIKTADGWQDFVSLALETSLGAGNVTRGRRYVLGTRAGEEVKTTPDLSVVVPAGSLVVDAKYKGRSPRPTLQIGAADLYESFAFSRASGVARVVLLYPRAASLPRVATGQTEQFDEVTVEGTVVTALNVECRGMSQLGGFRAFSEALASRLRAIP